MPRVSNFVETIVPEFSSMDFRMHCRIDWATFELILQTIALQASIKLIKYTSSQANIKLIKHTSSQENINSHNSGNRGLGGYGV